MLLSPMNPPAFSLSSTPLQNIYEDPLQHHMPASKRPKLSLQTSLPSVPYGGSSSQAGSNRVDNMATPTTRNTLANQYHSFDLSIRPSPVSTTASPAATTVSRPLARNKRSLPYDLNLPIGKRSILKNSSFPMDVRRGSLSAAASASPRSASGGRRVFFPEPKRVKFGTDEEIVNSKYTARHVDLSSSSEDEASSNGSENGANDAKESEEATDETAVTSKLSRRHGEAVIVDELQRGRNAERSETRKRTTKKRRRWEWTLGGVDSKGAQHPGASSEDVAQPDSKGDEAPSPSNASTSSSPSVATPSTPSEVTAKEPDVTVTEVVPTPTSATVKVQEDEGIALAQS